MEVGEVEEKVKIGTVAQLRGFTFATVILAVGVRATSDTALGGMQFSRDEIRRVALTRARIHLLVCLMDSMVGGDFPTDSSRPRPCRIYGIFTSDAPGCSAA